MLVNKALVGFWTNFRIEPKINSKQRNLDDLTERSPTELLSDINLHQWYKSKPNNSKIHLNKDIQKLANSHSMKAVGKSLSILVISLLDRIYASLEDKPLGSLSKDNKLYAYLLCFTSFTNAECEAIMDNAQQISFNTNDSKYHYDNQLYSIKLQPMHMDRDQLKNLLLENMSCKQLMLLAPHSEINIPVRIIINKVLEEHEASYYTQLIAAHSKNIEKAETRSPVIVEKKVLFKNSTIYGTKQQSPSQLINKDKYAPENKMGDSGQNQPVNYSTFKNSNDHVLRSSFGSIFTGNLELKALRANNAINMATINHESFEHIIVDFRLLNGVEERAMFTEHVKNMEEAVKDVTTTRGIGIQYFPIHVHTRTFGIGSIYSRNLTTTDTVRQESIDHISKLLMDNIDKQYQCDHKTGMIHHAILKKAKLIEITNWILRLLGIGRLLDTAHGILLETLLIILSEQIPQCNLHILVGCKSGKDRTMADAVAVFALKAVLDDRINKIDTVEDIAKKLELNKLISKNELNFNALNEKELQLLLRNYHEPIYYASNHANFGKATNINPRSTNDFFRQFFAGIPKMEVYAERVVYS